MVPMPGSTPTSVADQRADQAEQEIDWAKRDTKPEGEIGKKDRPSRPH